jgi:hypothetical protein
VAEYLDNTLPSDRVTDFEKVCLDSDVELAEVAACHQILTLVLGEPAEVHQESRARMYQLPETAASQTSVEGDETSTGRESLRIDKPAAPHRERARPAVPEYLREARWRRRRAYWLGAAVVLVGVVAVLAATGRLNGLFGSNEEPPTDQVVMNVPPKPQVPSPGPPPVEPTAPPLPAAETPDAEIDPVILGESITPPEQAVSTPGPVSDPLPIPDSIVPVTPTPAPSVPTDEMPVPPAPLAPTGEPALPSTPGPDPEQVAANVPAALAGSQEPIVVEPIVPVADVEAPEIGRLITPEEMALVGGNAGEALLRVSKTKPLVAGQRVVSLPTSRPVISVDGRLHVEMVDGGEMRLLPSQEDGPLNLEIFSGRMALATTDQAGAVTATLQAGGIGGDLFLADSTTLVAIEVGREQGPIQDPITQPAPAVVRLWGVSGKFTWKAAGEAIEMPMESPVMIDLSVSPVDVAPQAEAPLWIGTDLTGTLDRRASGMLNRAFGFEKTADLVLRENVYHRQKEMRRLARRSLSWIEDFEPIVEVLNESDRYSEWPDVIDLLRDSVRRSPRTARAVRESMGTEYGDRGDELYDLLWKYDVAEIPRQEAIRLVEYLDDDLLACRVLSFRNLNRITGLGYYYRPEENDAKRGLSLRRWSDWAERRPADQESRPPDNTPVVPSTLDPLVPRDN